MNTNVLTILLLCALWALAPATASAGDRQLVLVLGDSLSAAYGIPRAVGWVALLDESLKAQNIPARVVNASISGETTFGGRARLPALLTQYPATTLVIELGANNGLRGQSLDAMREDLQAMIGLAHEQGANVLLLGMHIPPNYGRKYTAHFHQVFIDVAAEQQTALLPFLLAGFATDQGMLQSDGLHPTAAAQPLILQNVLPSLLPLLRQAPAASEQTTHQDGAGAP